jgi:NADH-quinone oxidoreductase subunit L
MEQLVLFSPLLGAIICGFGHRYIGEMTATIIATSLLFFAAFLSWIIFINFQGNTEQIYIMRWIQSGELSSFWAIRLDRLTTIMLVVVNTVSALVHLYSFGYMKDDPNWKPEEIYKPRFFAYLSFFTFAMLMLVTSDNLLQMFFGWEGVGVASYLLIGFYWRKASANSAAMKAFIVNRVGDFGFALGIFGLFYMTGSINFTELFAAGPALKASNITFLWMDIQAIELLTFLLFIGAMGKSAQLFLHTWLPDAMEGPTPVSALIHAATMVTAGVFLVCRMSPLFEYAPGTLAFVTVVGATSAFIAATIGLVQNDIKRVIAYSTMSQLGYMFAAAGVGAYQAAMFHLFTHAFFKAMLFLGAGSVIHAMHHEQDMRNYGALRKKIPYTFTAMIIGTLAITGAGIPLTHFGFSGFLSKDAIIESTFAAQTLVGNYAFWLLVIAAAMTSFYSWRLIFLTFYGSPRGDIAKHNNAHESPLTIILPLAVLAIGSILAGMLWFEDFFGHHYKEFFDTAVYMGSKNHVIENAHHLNNWVKASPFIAMLSGLIISWAFYIKFPTWPSRLANTFQPLHSLLYNKYYFDEAYSFIFIKGSKFLGNLFWKIGDGKIIDGALNGLALRFIPFITKMSSKAQSGFLYHYAFAMFIGLGFLLSWFVIRGVN